RFSDKSDFREYRISQTSQKPDLHTTETFSMVLPPPNVTGMLHLGHAYEDALQDTIIRYKRMLGKKALWIPGTDSAAIATQAKVEKDIQKEENKSRHDLGREELVKRVSIFAQKSESTILNQVRRMGSSLDWSRYAYTLDEKRKMAVSTAFAKMYEAGLIYRGNRIVNWDPKGQTTISDDEIIYEEREAKLYTFKYSADFPISISTTRPETKVGDTAVAVHPEDLRYQKYIGQEFDLIFCEIPIHIKIIADQAVEKEFGTGALGVTPAHSQIDWEIADRHNLHRPQVINEYAKMTVLGILKDKKITEARETVVAWLKEQNLLEKEENIKQNISTSERTGAIIEPLPKLQWWIDVNKKFEIPYSEIPGIKSGDQVSLKEIMRESVSSGAVKINQERFQKIYFHWIENLRDWCISRQIWFGHRIPVWYHENKCVPVLGREKEISKCQEIIIGEINAGTDLGLPEVGPRPPEFNCEFCAAKFIQDPDTLDTWFSSGLWTFSTLGWPEKTEDLKKFYPTSLICPGYEILQLWISRMILMSGFHLGQVPFKEVMIHGIVRDKNGKKFSKSLGNGIDPIEIIEKYGADALRIGLIIGTAFGNDVKFDENKIKGYKHFANKLWNVSRFVLENANLEVEPPSGIQPAYTLCRSDLHSTKHIQEFDNLTKDITSDMENYNLHLAAEKIYHYIWHTFADEILEESKEIFKKDPESAEAIERKKVLFYILENSLKILHPFMPFITEEIWCIINKNVNIKENLLIIQKWPYGKYS
ncbi:MAG: valine--tRNA ligase, partial [Patescibacteria group bacterium]